MLIVGQNGENISKFNKDLSKSFALKGLGPAKPVEPWGLFKIAEKRQKWKGTCFFLLSEAEQIGKGASFV